MFKKSEQISNLSLKSGFSFQTNLHFCPEYSNAARIVWWTTGACSFGERGERQTRKRHCVVSPGSDQEIGVTGNKGHWNWDIQKTKTQGFHPDPAPLVQSTADPSYNRE